MTSEDGKPSREEIRKASNIGLLLGGIAFVLGALACLAYLLIYKPWRLMP